MSESDSLSDRRETSPHLQPFPLFSDAHFRLLFYLRGPSRSACWCHAPSITWTITREIMFSSYPPCPVTSPLLPCFWIRSGRLELSVFCTFVSSMVSATLGFWQGRLKYTRAVFSCAFGAWLTEFAEFIFHFLGGENMSVCFVTAL